MSAQKREIVRDCEMSYDRNAPRIEDVIREIFSTVPDEVWANVPTDLSYQLDHYLYGAEKR